MRDRRFVDEISTKELERIIATRKREQRHGKTSGFKRTRHASISRSLPSRLLMVVEVGVLLALVILGAQMIVTAETVRIETGNAQAVADQQLRRLIPTLEPTPVLSLNINDIVLPTGHRPPSSANAGEFNYDEIPVNIRHVVREQVEAPVISRPPVVDNTPLRLVIPALNIDSVIVQGVDTEALKLGVGQVLNGVAPDQADGNVVLAGHNDVYGEIFRHLDKLDLGDQFQIQTRTQVYTYVVREWFLVEPTAVEVMQNQGKSMVTLISCYPYRVNTQRIIVYADLVQA